MLSKHTLLFVMAGVMSTLAMVSAKTLPEETLFMNQQSKKAKAQPCCYPDAFETLFGEVIGYHDNEANTSGSQSITTFISYDATAKKMAYNTFISDYTVGAYKNVKVINDYPAHRSYLIYPKVNCTYTPLPGDFQKGCVPADAKLVASYHFGVDKQTIDMQSWMSTSASQTVVMGVDIEHCAPLSVLASGLEHSVGYMATGGSINMTLGIKDPSVFDPPEGCQPATQKYPALPGHLIKFLGAVFA